MTMMDSLDIIAFYKLELGKLNEPIKDYLKLRSLFAQPMFSRLCMFCDYARPRYQVIQDHWFSCLNSLTE